MSHLFNVFSIYLPLGFSNALKVILRILILPFWKINNALPKAGLIIDVGCGDGGLTNYLASSAKDRFLIGIDTSGARIGLAKKAARNISNVKFIKGNIVKSKLKKADAYFLVDVLHHISFANQKILLRSIVNNMKGNSVLVIKEVDKSNFIPFWFGHVIERILYPKENIYTRSQASWETLFSSLNLSYKTEDGSPAFPDSTLVFVCKRKIS